MGRGAWHADLRVSPCSPRRGGGLPERDDDIFGSRGRSGRGCLRLQRDRDAGGRRWQPGLAACVHLARDPVDARGAVRPAGHGRGRGRAVRSGGGCRSSDGRGRRLLRVNPQQGTPTSSSTYSTTGTTSTASRFCAAAATRPSRAAGCSSSKKLSRPATRQAQGRSSTCSCSWWADASAHRPSTGELFEQAGYEFKRIIPTATPLHVIEATAR